MNANKVDDIVCTQYFSWSAVLIGGLVAFGLGFLINVFGDGIGLSLYTNDPSGATTLAIGGFIASIIGAIATMFVAGFAAGFFAGPSCGNRNYGIAYGFAAWCVGLLLIGAFANNISNVLSNQAQQLNTPATQQEVAQTTKTVAAKVHPATDASDTQAEQNVRAAGLMSLAFFIVLFIGAASACFGGCYGFHLWDKWRVTRV